MPNKEIGFLKPLVKIGGSLCIRVPKNAVGYLKLTEGDVVDIAIKVPQEEKIPEKFLLPYKKHLPQLKDFSLDLLNSCMFFFNIENSLEDKEKVENFEKTIVREKGEEFLEKYKIFREAVKDMEAMKKIAEDSMKSSDDFKKSMEISTGKKFE